MNLKKYQEQIGEVKKVYVDMDPDGFKQKLVNKLKIAEYNREGSGYSGRYSKKNDRITIRGYYSKNLQGQPKLINDYYYLGEIGTDIGGTYFEYVLVKDKMITPLSKAVYIVFALALLGYTFFCYNKGSYSLTTVITMAIMVAVTVLLNLKKSKETPEMCKLCEPFFVNYIKYL